MAERLLVSTRKGLFEIARGAHGWRISDLAFAGTNVSLTLPGAPGEFEYAALDHGHFGAKLQRRRGGEPWQEAPRPALPARPEGAPDDTTSDGKPIPWRVERIWALERGGSAEENTLWCGTIPGALFVSRDAGESWEFVSSLWNTEGRRLWSGGGADYPGIHSICVDPRQASSVRVGVSTGGVWQTDDGGVSWSVRADGMRAAYMPPERAFDPNVQDVHHMVQCPAEPDVLWCQHHNGIFVTRDGAQSWTEVTTAKPSCFGFAVAVHPRDPDTAWFVPAVSDERRMAASGRLVVSRTSDGGRSFEVLSRGLPQSHAYDLVFRHALDVDARGERLAFGSTTGGLWVSEDAGESWLAVEGRLPPIHAVRFGA